jgi:predicted amidohydrolase YtcJ
MRDRPLQVGFWVSLLLAPLGSATAAEADLVLYNTHVITVDPKFSIQSTVVVKEGKIVAVGGSDLAKTDHARTRIDLHGKTLMPGFVDTHLHPMGKSPRAIEATSAHSMAELQQMLREKAAQLRPGEWITGGGWQEVQFKENRNPTATPNCKQ